MSGSKSCGWLRAFVCAGALTVASWMAAPAAASPSTEPRFGFSGPEIFPIDNFMSHLKVADIDGDGLKDLVVVNNNQSKIHILYNRTGKTNRTTVQRSARLELNELPPDARFRIESLASEKRISSLVLRDLNGDKRPDLAYYGEPRELVVLYNKGTNGWESPRLFDLDLGQLSGNALDTGDVNGDGRADLVLLGENALHVLYQSAEHALNEPVLIPVSGAARSVQVLDIDGDSRDDVLLVNWEERYPFRFRLQRHDGQLGPEVYFAHPPIRSYWADNLEPKGKTQVITIAQLSGRAQVSEFRLKNQDAAGSTREPGQLQVTPLRTTERARRGVLWSDVNRDERPDFLSAEPDSGQVSVYLTRPDGSLGSPAVFPTLSGVAELASVDWDGDGAPEIFQLSTEERQVGVSRPDSAGRLPFPEIEHFEGRPLVLAVGRVFKDGGPALAVALDHGGRRSVVFRNAGGESSTHRLSEDYKSNPSSLALHDVDQDGLTDLVMLTPYEKIKILRQVAEKKFEELDIAPPGGAIEQPWLGRADTDADGKPELLMAQRNFVRAVVLQKRSGDAKTSVWTFAVKDQVNGAAASSRLAGAVFLGSLTNKPSMVLLDTDRKALSLCERNKEGTWAITRNIQLPIADFNGLELVGRADNSLVSLLGLKVMATLPLHGPLWELAEMDGYETPIKDGRLTDVVSGDLDNDGRKDLVFLETSRNYLDLVTYDAAHKLSPANRWPVFEERTFKGRRSDLPEPREAVVDDVTGDGKNDLVVLVHDRILLYPQE